MTIKKAEPSDSGEYKCIITNEIGSVTSTTNLDISKKPVKAEVIVKMKDSNAVEGGQARFDVKFKGEPSPKVDWYHDKTKVVDGERIKIVQSDDDHLYSLIIDDLGPEDSGKYKCVAQNEAGETVEQAKLVVKEKPIAPDFEGEQFKEPLVYVEGDEVDVKLNLKAKPFPDIKWYKDGRRLRDNKFIKTSFVDGECKLKIENASPDDSGNYKCEASNEVGTSSRDFDLEVKGI